MRATYSHPRRRHHVPDRTPSRPQFTAASGRSSQRRPMTSFLVSATLPWLAACAAQPSDSSPDPGATFSNAVPYYLPAVEFDIELTWMLTNCQLPDSRGVEFAVTADVTPKFVADPRQQFTIDYSSLHSAFKRTDLQIDLYENGTLRSVNAASTDKAADFLTSLVKAAGSFFRIIRWPIGQGLFESEPCRHTSLAALERRQQLRGQLHNLTRRIEALAARSPLTDADKTLIQTTNEDLTIKTNALSRIEARLSHTHRLSWMPTASENRTEIPLDRDVLDRLFAPGYADIFEATGYAMTVTAALCPPESRAFPCVWSHADQPHPQGADRLIVYRLPRRAALTLRYDTLHGPTNEIYRASISVPQAGPLRTLDLTHHVFDDKTLSARFAQTGALTQVRYLGAAKAAVLSKALRDTLSTVESEVVSSPSKELQQLRNKADFIKAEAELIQAKRALDALLHADDAG